MWSSKIIKWCNAKWWDLLNPWSDFRSQIYGHLTCRVCQWYLTLLFPYFSDCGKMSPSKRSAPYWSNPPFLFFDIRVLWRSLLSARVSERRKLKMIDKTSMALNVLECNHLISLGLKGLTGERSSILACILHTSHAVVQCLLARLWDPVDLAVVFSYYLGRYKDIQIRQN